MEQIRRGIVFLYKIFFVGLLLQFFLHTFVTFKLGLDQPRMDYIWLWKEGVIVLFGILSLVGIILTKGRKKHFNNPFHTFFLITFIVAVGISILTHFYFAESTFGAYAMAFKYDFLGFVIFLVCVHSGLLLDKDERLGLIKRYGTVIKYMLLLALIWYFIIFIKPGTLKLFGYNNFVFEGLVGSAPPATYYTQINFGLPRNQFLFERPTTRGFFLTALWPFFYLLFLHKKPRQETRLRRVIYSLNIIVTFSRAARGTWIILLFLIPFILLKDRWKTFFIKIGLPIIGLLALISIVGFDQIMNRSYSNYGHITMVKLGREMFMESPLRGVGGATAGPGSHRGGMTPFNPENQFLQIMIEFGAVGFIGWILLFGSLCRIGIKEYFKTNKTLITRNLLLGASLGMIALAISGMVLHSFADRMVVYPFMALFGLIIAYRYSENSENNTDL